MADLTVMGQIFGDYHGYFAVSLSSQDPRKNWPVERFATVAQKIYDTYHMPCCLVVTIADRPLADKFMELYHGKCEDLIGKTSLPQLFAVLSDGQFLLCNDTGNMHAAIACRTKCFGITTDRWYPRFTDYPPQLFDNQKDVPVFLRADYDCRGCFVHYSASSLRSNCLDDPLTLRPYDCVSAVTTDLVWDAVTNWLSQYWAIK